MDWIQGYKFFNIGDSVYAPKEKSKEDYYNITNTFNPFILEEDNIIYTHTSYVPYLINIIRYLNSEFVIISHNSDCAIEDYGISIPNGKGEIIKEKRFDLPDNVIKWFGTNVNTINPKIESIPIGLENDIWFRRLQKKTKMSNVLKTQKNHKNLVYMNHNIGTNPEKRIKLYRLLEKESWVTAVKGYNGQDFTKYINNVYNHKFVICPSGNGIDTIRTWETLYMGSFPIEKRNINNSFYADLPICFVNDWEEVTEYFLDEEYERLIQGKWNLDKLTFEYWKNKIQSYD